MAAIARCCHTFNEPATDALWVTQWDLVNLVKCMPPDAWKEVETAENSDNFCVHFTRPLLPNDFTRFDSLARRVKNLGMELHSSPPKSLTKVYDLSPDVFVILDFHRGSQPLLPNLKALGCSPERSDISFDRMLLGPKLQSLFVKHEQWPPPSERDDRATNVLTYAPYLSPDIRVLTFYQNLTTPQALAVIEAIGKFRALQVLAFHFPPVRKVVVEFMNQLPSLRTLQDISIVDAVGFDFHEPIETVLPAMPALRGITMTVRDVTLGVAMLKALQETPLTYINMQVYLKEGDLSFTTFFKAFEHLRVPERLTTIELHGQLSENLELLEIDPCFDVAKLKPLYPFRNLEHLHIDIAYPVNVDNSSLAVMATAWPNLNELVLGSLDAGTMPLVTLEGLVPLAKTCQKLQVLGLVVDASTVPQYPNSAWGDDCQNQALREMRVGESDQPEAPEEVAGFLSYLFPNITMVHTVDLDDDEEETTESNAWQKVNDLIGKKLLTVLDHL
ncbi:hypothetical protein BKA93DRAFT_822645 [Sparassis latifolia]